MEEFPLLTEALKFYNHDDHMVRVAVRTLTLNIYGIEDVGMREYIANRTAGEEWSRSWQPSGLLARLTSLHSPVLLQHRLGDDKAVQGVGFSSDRRHVCYFTQRDQGECERRDCSRNNTDDLQPIKYSVEKIIQEQVESGKGGTLPAQAHSLSTDRQLLLHQ